MSSDTNLPTKLIALVVLLLAGYILLKVIIGLVTVLVWILIVIAAMIAFAWAARTL